MDTFTRLAPPKSANPKPAIVPARLEFNVVFT